MAKPAFRYSHYDLQRQPAGTIVEVSLSAINNVRLIDEQNFNLFRQFQPHKYAGGLVKTTPVRLTVPADGHWHVVVDMDGLPALADSSVKTYLPGKRAPAAHAQSVVPAHTSAAAKGLGKSKPEDRASTERVRDQIETYKHIANTDTLTGLGNRRAFDVKLETLYRNAEDLQNTAVILLDVDDFHTFNERHGRLAGDLVLGMVADILAKNLRKDAFAARTGGEEFVIVIEGVGRALGVQIAERVLKAVPGEMIADPQSGVHYGQTTISMGLCMAHEASGPQMLYAKCDAALRAAKAAGGNRCFQYDDETMDDADPIYLSGSAHISR